MTFPSTASSVCCPKIEDERLTPEQRENYYRPGGVGTQTGEQVLECARTRIRRRAGRREHHIVRRREPARLPWLLATSAAPSACTSSRTESCAARSTPSIRNFDRRLRMPTPRRRSRACRRPSGYPGNNFNEDWATGIEAYVFGSGQDRESLLKADPRLYELVRQVIPSTKMPGNVYVGRVRQPQKK